MPTSATTYKHDVMIKYLINKCKKLFRSLGVEVSGYTPTQSISAQIVASLNYYNIDLVLDIGANCGQFAEDIRSGGYVGKIISFEPLSSAYSALVKASVADNEWEVYERCAIGAKGGVAVINIAANSASSSILNMMDSHIDAAPHSAYIGTETVPVLTLDSIFRDFADVYKSIFVKIDVQGFEWEVLDGAIATIPHLRGLLIEMSIIPLYQNQHLWEEIVQRLKVSGFHLWALQPGFTDPKNGRTLQFDGIFFRHS